MSGQTTQNEPDGPPPTSGEKPKRASRRHKSRPERITHLEVTTSKGDRRRLRLDGRNTTIGRGPENHLVLSDKEASRNHCVIEPLDEGFRVRDLGSRNGTLLNEEKISIELLQHNDVIRIGKTKMRFVDHRSTVSPKEMAILNGADDRTSPPPQYDLASAAEVNAKAYDESLTELSEGCGNAPFAENEISLIDARGEVLHQGFKPETEEEKAEALATGEGIRAMRLLLHAACAARATDIHIEPKRDITTVRMRVDGYMVPACDMSRDTYQRVFGLVKVLCQIENTRKNTVQEGHLGVQVPDRRIDYRISFTPSMYGQKLVIRVLDTANAPTRLHDLGMVGWMHDKVRTLLARDSGMLVSCGPTGSGKTTTLYSCLREINNTQRNVITIEDPVEYSLEGCTQIPIDAKHGNSFGEMLRSVLRQDPDVIYVGEIRDPETARTAMQAATTGHLVFTTVHAKNAIGAIFRLLDLGVEPYLVANSLNIILAQRLVRVLCDVCKKPMRPLPEQVRRMGRSVEGMTTIYTPTGCRRCLKTGFHGRRAIFELLELTDDLRDVVLNRPAIQDIRRIVNTGLFNTLQQSGYQLVREGVTSADEIERVAGDE